MSGSRALNRRSVLQLAGSAVLALGLPVLPAPAIGGEPRTRLVLVDRRYEVSVFFAQGFDGVGAAEILPIGRDLAKLCRQHIAPRLDRGPLAIEAVTLPADLFGIECLVQGSGAVTVARRDVIDESAPRQGRPKHLVYWRMRFGAKPSTAIG